MKISILQKSTLKEKNSLVVMLAQKPEQKEAKKADSLDYSKIYKSFSASQKLMVQKLIKDKVFQARTGESLFLPECGSSNSQHLLLVGLGPVKKITVESIRQATAYTVRCLEQKNQTHVVCDFSSLLYFIKNPLELASTLCEGFILSNYLFNHLKKHKDKKITPLKQVFLKNVSNPKMVNLGITQGQCLAESINFARTLSDYPSNLMTPSILASSVQKQSKGLKDLKVSVWNKARIVKEKMGGVLGVSSGSNQEPRVIIMEYKPKKAKNKHPYCFVGKGLTFDSGGISLKPAKNMDEMKFDMCGSAAVIGALMAVARLKLNVSVIGLVGSSENMPGAAATKPSDILKARNGKTMEVLNTDAEGRLVLADILSYACEKQPEFIVDAATLTGAIVVALGNIYTGLFTRHKSLREKIQKAALKAGEKMWPMPLDDFHVKDIKSHVGDVANISSTGGAGSSTAAAFLEHFVDKKIPWAHLDIAGTAWNVENRLPYCRPKSASGVMVRTFVELCKIYRS